MYAHKLIKPQSVYIKYRGNTGQIDVKDTVLSILAKNPGLTFTDIAKLIYNKDLHPLSYGYVNKVLRALQTEGAIIRSGRFYYLTSDAVSHDMAKTAVIVETLGKEGVSLEQARFLSSGIIMAAESHIAESNDQNFNIDETVAAGVASAPEKTTSIQITSEEYGWVPEGDFCEYPDVKFEKNEDGNYTISGTVTDVESFCDDFDIDTDVTSAELFNSQVSDDVEVPEELEIEDPFASMGDTEREALKDEADELIAQSYIDEDAAAAVIESDRKEKLKLNAMSAIKNATDMLESKVEINPGKFNGQVIGTVLEVRPTGMTFLITHSTDDTIEFGTVLPLEYSNGLTYKLVFDFDTE